MNHGTTCAPRSSIAVSSPISCRRNFGASGINYGFVVSNQRKEKLTACRALLGWVDPQRPYIADLEAFLESRGIDYTLCPSWGEGTTCCVYNVLSFHDPPHCCLEAA
jgi:hypothetical protein